MSYSKETGTFLSSNKSSTVTYFIYKPEGEIKAMIQVVHGMAEYIERYEPYFEFLTKKGFLVFGDDHIGHKGSVKNDEELGYFAPKDGWKCMVKDEEILTRIIKEKYPEIPVFLYGHSMGSFISRAYITKYADLLDGVILSGSAGSNSALGMGRFITKIIYTFKGETYRSPFLDKLMFGSYNKQFENPRNSFDWLSRDEKVVDAYIDDKYCGFLFTTSGYIDLENLLGFITSDSWYEKVPVELPILFISGAMDPVGGWGKGMEEIDEKMKKVQRKDYEMKVFPEMRHELHNEIGKEEVWDYVSQWIEKRC